MVTLGGRDIMKYADQLLADQVFMKKGKVLDGMEDGRVGEDGGIERMGGKGGYINRKHPLQSQQGSRR